MMTYSLPIRCFLLVLAVIALVAAPVQAYPMAVANSSKFYGRTLDQLSASKDEIFIGHRRLSEERAKPYKTGLLTTTTPAAIALGKGAYLVPIWGPISMNPELPKIPDPVDCMVFAGRTEFLKAPSYFLQQPLSLSFPKAIAAETFKEGETILYAPHRGSFQMLIPDAKLATVSSNPLKLRIVCKTQKELAGSIETIEAFRKATSPWDEWKISGWPEGKKTTIGTGKDWTSYWSLTEKYEPLPFVEG